MYQLGGRHWRQFFPPTVNVLLRHQHRHGYWESEDGDAEWRRAFTTDLLVTALNTPNQLLPIFQR